VIDLERLRSLEERLEPWNLDRSPDGLRLLGYGEISAVFALGDDDSVAYKRMPLFSSAAQARDYASSYARYTALLREAGLELPEDETALVEVKGRPVVLYLAQRRLPSRRFVHTLVREGDAAGCRELIGAVCERIARVFAFNAARRPELELAIDGQLSNWALLEDSRLFFVDTSTPLFRLAGREQLDPELLLASAPGFLRGLLRVAFLEEVMERYYRPRQVYLDLVANLHKEGRPDLVPAALDVVNGHLPGERPLTVAEVRRYYAGDRRIWSAFLAARRLDRWITTRLARRRYEFVLPGTIRR